MATVNRHLTSDWTELATGEGFATFTPWSREGVEWVVAVPGTNPPMGLGHWVGHRDTLHLYLLSDEALFVRGRDQIALTADHEVL